MYGYEQYAPSGKQLIGTSMCTYCFDVSVREFFSILCFGGTLHVLTQNIFLDAENFVKYLVDNHVTSIYILPVLLPDIVNQFEKQFENSNNQFEDYSYILVY